MAYDRYEREQRWREGRSDRPDQRDPRAWDQDRNRSDRGFFDRMGDEVRSWFGDEDAERRPARDEEFRRRARFDEAARPTSWNTNDRDFNEERYLDRYGREGARDFGRWSSPWGRDPYRQTSLTGSRDPSNRDDHHYEQMRRRQADDLDRDYDEYRRERASQFESDFGAWRNRRQSKRQMLRDIREDMEVVGSDEKHVGTVDRIAGDRIILTRSDPDAGGAHHSLSCSDIDRVEGDRVILECNADKAHERWRDESRSRALFEREDQGEAGPHMLDRSFSGTYR